MRLIIGSQYRLSTAQFNRESAECGTPQEEITGSSLGVQSQCSVHPCTCNDDRPQAALSDLLMLQHLLLQGNIWHAYTCELRVGRHFILVLQFLIIALFFYLNNIAPVALKSELQVI